MSSKETKTENLICISEKEMRLSQALIKALGAGTLLGIFAWGIIAGFSITTWILM